MEKPPPIDPVPLEEQAASPESVETVNQLRSFLEQGFLLHGSKHPVDSLEPRQATDTDKEKIIGNQLAIYGTRHLEIPLFMALKDRKDPSVLTMRSGYSGNGDGTWQMYGENTTLSSGYVYVLPSETFEIIKDEQGAEELVSRVPVMPVAVFKVEPDILNLFPNVSLDLK